MMSQEQVFVVIGASAPISAQPCPALSTCILCTYSRCVED